MTLFEVAAKYIETDWKVGMSVESGRAIGCQLALE